MNEIKVDFDYISDIGQKIREFLCSDLSRAKFTKSVIDFYYQNSQYPPGIIKKIADMLTSTKSKECLNIVDGIRAIIHDDDNIENLLGLIFFPNLFESDAIMRPDIVDQLSVYIKNGGNTELITQVLMQHYRGIPNMINIISKILKDVAHIDSQEIIKQQIKDTTISIFKMYKMDNLLLTREKIPKEFKIMFKDDFWVDTIITLSENKDYSKSMFIAYCMNKICKYHPEKIKSLPPFYISYNSFQNVMQCILKKMKDHPDPALVDSLIKIISTDDLTLTHSALIFHDLPSEGLIKIAEKLNDSKRNLFDKIKFANGSEEDNELSKIITKNANLRISELNSISELEDISPHMITLIVQKISKDLRESGSSEASRKAEINCLLKITGQTLNDTERDYIYHTFDCIYESTTKLKRNLGEVLQAVRFPFINDIIKDIVIDQINPNMSPPSKYEQSPQSNIICEIAYHFRDKIPGMVDSLVNAIKSNNSRGNVEFLYNEIFSIFKYFIRLGYSKEVLRRYSKMMTSDMKSPHVHRKFVLDLFQLKFPNDFHIPAVCRFVEAMTYLFDNKCILDKIIPESSTDFLKNRTIFKDILTELKKFLDKIPDDINISENAMQSISSVRFKLDSLNF